MNISRFVAVSSLLLGLASCSASPSSPLAVQPTAIPTNVPADASVRLRVVNGSPGTGNVDVYLYIHGTLRPATPTFSGIPFGGVTPFVRELDAAYDMDVLRTGAVSTEAAIVHGSSVDDFAQLDAGQANSYIGSLVISGTSLDGTRAIQFFNEPQEHVGQSALIVHHASPSANRLTALGSVGIGVYSATSYPPGTVPTAIAPRATKQLFPLTFVQNPQAVPNPNAISSDGAMLFLTPFPASSLSPEVGFAVGLPARAKTAYAPLASVIANAALSETANENSPFANQNAITNDSTETIRAGTHISEFLIDADQNGNIGLIGSVDP